MLIEGMDSIDNSNLDTPNSEIRDELVIKITNGWWGKDGRVSYKREMFEATRGLKILFRF